MKRNRKNTIYSKKWNKQNKKTQNTDNGKH